MEFSPLDGGLGGGEGEIAGGAHAFLALAAEDVS